VTWLLWFTTERCVASHASDKNRCWTSRAPHNSRTAVRVVGAQRSASFRCRDRGVGGGPTGTIDARAMSTTRACLAVTTATRRTRFFHGIVAYLPHRTNGVGRHALPHDPVPQLAPGQPFKRWPACSSQDRRGYPQYIFNDAGVPRRLRLYSQPKPRKPRHSTTTSLHFLTR